MLRYGRAVLLRVLMVLAVSAGGCQRGPTWNLAPVEGTVTKDGRPWANITVVFQADPDSDTVGPRSSDLTDAAGHYRLRTDNGDDGAVVGKHRILFIDAEVAVKHLFSRPSRRPQRKATAPLSPEMAKRNELLKKAEDVSRVPPRYGRFHETPLHAEVRPGSQILNFDIP